MDYVSSFMYHKQQKKCMWLVVNQLPVGTSTFVTCWCSETGTGKIVWICFDFIKLPTQNYSNWKLPILKL